MRQSRKGFPCYGQHQSSMEDLPNELFLQIFNYLAPKDLFKTFRNLNSRFCALIRSVFIQLRMTNDNIHLLSKIKASQIKSVVVNYSSDFNMVLNYIQANHLIQLERLDFSLVEVRSILNFLKLAPKLDHLKFFRICVQSSVNCDESEVCYQTIAELLFTLPVFKQLKYIELLISNMTPYYGHMLRPNPLSMLEYFSICNICLDDLALILAWMPQIKSIKIVYAFMVNDDDDDQQHEYDLTTRALMKMPAIVSLRRLDIGICHGVTCKHMQLLLNKLSELRRFNCVIWSEDSLSIEHWIRIFLQSKIDSLHFILSIWREWMYSYLSEGLKADIWHRQIFNTAAIKSVSGGICLEANGINVSRIAAAKELDDQSSNEHQNKKQRIN